MPNVVPASHADVEAGRIILRAPLSALLLCRRIPNGSWDSQRKAWSFPATREQARRVQGVIHRLSTTRQFDELVAPSIARDPAAAPVAPTPEPAAPAEEAPVVLTEGLLTRPWRHQLAAFQFCLQHFALGMFGLLLAMGMGTGKTLVAFMVLLERKAKRTLILSPLRVVPVWVTQLERHVDIPLVVVALDDSVGSVKKKQELAAEKMRLAEARGVPFVCIINYDSSGGSRSRRGQRSCVGPVHYGRGPPHQGARRQGVPGMSSGCGLRALVRLG